MYDRQVIVNKIMSWIGAKEGDTVHKHIIDTYNAYKPLPQGYKVKYTDAWCATTVSAAAIEVGYDKIIPIECSCKRMIDKAKSMGIWQENDAYVPKKGDIILYDWNDTGVGDNTGVPDHVGLVATDVSGNQFQVCEGNKSDAVGLRTFTVNARYIRGYIIPKYNDVLKPATTPAPIKINGKYGIDVSACQSNVNFAKVKADGYEYVILRSTTKDGKPDVKFEKYYADAKKAGIQIAGVYKLCYAHNIIDAQKEAMGVIKLLNGRKETIWLDMEDYGGQQIYNKDYIAFIITAFLTTCVNAGYDVGIYCNLDWYNNHIKDDIKKICKFWIARYGKNTGSLDESYKPTNIKGMIMWQFTSHGAVDGITGNVDLDVRC